MGIIRNITVRFIDVYMANNAMVKTTIILEDQLYRMLVNEAVAEYGSTRKLSLLINRKLREAGKVKKETKTKKIRVKLNHWLTEKELEERIEEGWDEAVKWSV